jgi:hypothetical protein
VAGKGETDQRRHEDEGCLRADGACEAPHPGHGRDIKAIREYFGRPETATHGPGTHNVKWWNLYIVSAHFFLSRTGRLKTKLGIKPLQGFGDCSRKSSLKCRCKAVMLHLRLYNIKFEPNKEYDRNKCHHLKIAISKSIARVPSSFRQDVYIERLHSPHGLLTIFQAQRLLVLFIE